MLEKPKSSQLDPKQIFAHSFDPNLKKQITTTNLSQFGPTKTYSHSFIPILEIQKRLHSLMKNKHVLKTFIQIWNHLLYKKTSKVDANNNMLHKPCVPNLNNGDTPPALAKLISNSPNIKLLFPPPVVAKGGGSESLSPHRW